MKTQSYAVYVYTHGDEVKGSTNGVRLPTTGQAQRYGQALLSRWTVPSGFDVRKTPDPVTHNADKWGTLTTIEKCANCQAPDPQRELRGSYVCEPCFDDLYDPETDG